MPNIIVDGISIAMVCFTITMSMGMMFAQKVGYKIDSNQELFALVIISNICQFERLQILRFYN